MLLADTLYRVPRERGLHVIQRRGPRQAQWLTSRRLILEPGEPAAHRSSCPPHKHDGAHGEVRLEEVYHFRIDPPNGFAHQSLYTDSGESVVHSVHDGDAVMLPYGYHPVSAPPGYRVYYLWALAGERRQLAPYEDPQHRWIHTAEAAVRN